MSHRIKVSGVRFQAGCIVRARPRPRHQGVLFDFEDEHEYDDEDDWSSAGLDLAEIIAGWAC
jgi:hypothetical protein